jgi:hypothetical protein
LPYFAVSYRAHRARSQVRGDLELDVATHH